MTESIEEWLTHVTNSEYKVWVENPETMKETGFMGKTYVTFRVLLKSSDTELIAVRHRFSEFCTLRDLLKDRYSAYGLLVPSLPQKKVIGALEKEFITERMQGLTLFCEAIVANPWLRRDPSWLEFMSSPAPLTVPKKGQEVVKAPSELILQNILDRLPIPSNPLERSYEIKEEITSMEKQLQITLEASRVVQKHQTALNLANQSLHAAFDGWATIETNPTSKYLNANSLEANSCAMKLRDEEKAPIIVSKITSSLADRSNATQDLSEYATVLMSSYLDHEIARIASLRDLLRFHDETVTSIDTLRVKVEKMEAQSNTKIDQLQEIKKQLELKKLQLNSFYKGFYFFSLPLNSKLKSQNLRKMVSNYGSTMLVTSHTLLTASKQLLKELFISPTQAISDTSQILDLLSLKPLDEPPEGLPGPNEGLTISPPWVEALYYSALQSITAPGFLQYSSSLPSPPPPASSPSSSYYSPSSPGKVAAVSSPPSTTTTSTTTTTSSEQMTTQSTPVVADDSSSSNQLFSSNSSPSKNPFDNVDSVVSGPSIGAGAATASGGATTKKSTNPFDDGIETTDSNLKSEVKITPVDSVRVNQELLGDLLGDDKKENQSIWG